MDVTRHSFKVGIVGHRFIQSPEAEGYVTRKCLAILMEIQKGCKHVTALSAIAQGADSIFAETALSLAIPLEIVRPFDEYPADFSDEKSKATYCKLRSSAINEEKLSFSKRSTEAYFQAMKWVVTRSDVLIAVWDGNPPRGRGGTADAVTQAQAMHRDWIHLNVSDLSSKFYCMNYPLSLDSANKYDGHANKIF